MSSCSCICLFAYCPFFCAGSKRGAAPYTGWAYRAIKNLFAGHGQTIPHSLIAVTAPSVTLLRTRSVTPFFFGAPFHDAVVALKARFSYTLRAFSSQNLRLNRRYTRPCQGLLPAGISRRAEIFFICTAYPAAVKTHLFCWNFPLCGRQLFVSPLCLKRNLFTQYPHRQSRWFLNGIKKGGFGCRFKAVPSPSMFFRRKLIPWQRLSQLRYRYCVL